MGQLYLLTFPNGKRYVGQTYQRMSLRLNGHRKVDSFVGRAIRKHGEPEVSTLFEVRSQSAMDALEVQLIDDLGTLAPNGYNLEKGGRGGVPSAAARKKMSIAATGRKASANARARMSAAQKGKQHRLGHTASAATRKKISEALTGHAVTTETRRKLSESLAGRKLSAEHCEKISQLKSGTKHSPETRAKMRASQQARRAREI